MGLGGAATSAALGENRTSPSGQREARCPVGTHLPPAALAAGCVCVGGWCACCQEGPACHRTSRVSPRGQLSAEGQRVHLPSGQDLGCRHQALPWGTPTTSVTKRSFETNRRKPAFPRLKLFKKTCFEMITNSRAKTFQDVMYILTKSYGKSVPHISHTTICIQY